MVTSSSLSQSERFSFMFTKSYKVCLIQDFQRKLEAFQLVNIEMIKRMLLSVAQPSVISFV